MLLRARNQAAFELPIFLPVYHPTETPMPICDWPTRFGIQGCIVNAFFLYKDRELRRRLTQETSLQDHIGFSGLVMTDSGAFQGFQGNLYLKNKTIVQFQQAIGADIVSPLDLVSPPGEKRSIAEKKWRRTLIRIREARQIATQSMLAGVQQGGRFHDLRRQCTQDLLELDIQYLALGSLVPFFNKNHDLEFVGKVIRDARQMVGPDMPMHVYGAGDPLELPFMAALGATVFDSSSYGHYARQGWYMTPYGALQTKDAHLLMASDFKCECPWCLDRDDKTMIWTNYRALASHNLWMIMDTLKAIRQALTANDLDRMLSRILSQHTTWFPQSGLQRSWERLQQIS